MNQLMISRYASAFSVLQVWHQLASLKRGEGPECATLSSSSISPGETAATVGSGSQDFNMTIDRVAE